MNNNTMISNNMTTSSAPSDKHHHDNEEPMNINMVIRSNITMNEKVFGKKQQQKNKKNKRTKITIRKNVKPKWKCFGLFIKLKSCSPLNSYVPLLTHSCDGVTFNPNAQH